MKKKRFFKLIDEFYSNLERFALHLTRNRDFAKDLVSDTVIAAYNGRKSIRDEQAFLSYIFTICRRIYYRELKKAINYTEQTPDEIFSRELSPEIRTDLVIIYNALDSIEPEEKELILLHEISGFKYREIAEIMNISIDNVKVKLHRAKNKVSEILSINESEKK